MPQTGWPVITSSEPTSEPGAAHSTFIRATSGLSVATGVTRTFTGGSMGAEGVVSTVSFAFCARLEKLLLRDDMYL